MGGEAEPAPLHPLVANLASFAFLGSFVLGLVEPIVWLLAVAALLIAQRSALSGVPSGFREAWPAALRQLPTILLVAFVVLVAAVLGSSLVIGPLLRLTDGSLEVEELATLTIVSSILITLTLLLAATRFGLAPLLVLFRSASVNEALRESRRATAGQDVRRALATWAVILLPTLVGAVLGLDPLLRQDFAAFRVTTAGLSAGLVRGLAWSLVGLLYLPLAAGVLLLLGVRHDVVPLEKAPRPRAERAVRTRRRR
jgi:hypothetical protein